MTTPFQRIFVLEYLRDHNATHAYKRAGGKGVNADVLGPRMLGEVGVAELIASEEADRARDCRMEVNDVLKMWCEIATADPNELVRVVFESCRHCWGAGFKYQWRDVTEWVEACERAALEHAKKYRAWQRRIAAGRADGENDEPTYDMPDASGGFGFNPRIEPNHECPKCEGHGMPRDIIADTRKLSGPARRLYAGVKRTRDGIQVLTRDQDAAAANVAKYLGMMVDRVQHSGALGRVPADDVEALKKLTPEELMVLMTLREKMS